MANTVQIKRGSTASVAGYTGPVGELIYNSSTKRVHTQDGVTAGGSALALLTDIGAATDQFATRAAFAAFIAAGNVPVEGRIYSAGGLFYVGKAGSTNIVDMPGVVPAGIPQPGHYGIFGAGSYTTAKNKASRDWSVSDASGEHWAQNGAAINRMADRLFLGDAIKLDGAYPSVEKDWFAEYQGTHELLRVFGTAGVTTQGSPIITFTAGAIVPGVGDIVVADFGIPDGARVLTINSPTQITLTANATATTANNVFLAPGGLANPGTGNNATLYVTTHLNPPSASPAVFAAQSKYFNAAGTSCIGVSAFAINNNETLATNAWGGYFEAHLTNDAVGSARGIEIDVSSWRTTPEINPTPFQQTKTSGLQIGAGTGLDPEGQVNVGAAIQIVNNQNSFRKGIVFLNRSIEGTDGLTGAGEAITLATGHQLSWYASNGAVAGRIQANAGLTSAQRAEMRFSAGGIQFLGAAGQVSSLIQQIPGSVNYLALTPAVAGGAPVMTAQGTDANIDLRLLPKGTGQVRFGTFSASADVEIIGSITIKDNAGNPIKLAVIA